MHFSITRRRIHAFFNNQASDPRIVQKSGLGPTHFSIIRRRIHGFFNNQPSDSRIFQESGVEITHFSRINRRTLNPGMLNRRTPIRQTLSPGMPNRRPGVLNPKTLIQNPRFLNFFNCSLPPFLISSGFGGRRKRR